MVQALVSDVISVMVLQPAASTLLESCWRYTCSADGRSPMFAKSPFSATHAVSPATFALNLMVSEFLLRSIIDGVVIQLGQEGNQ